MADGHANSSPSNKHFHRPSLLTRPSCRLTRKERSILVSSCASWDPHDEFSHRQSTERIFYRLEITRIAVLAHCDPFFATRYPQRLGSSSIMSSSPDQLADILHDDSLAPLKRNHACLNCKKRKTRCCGVSLLCLPYCQVPMSDSTSLFPLHEVPCPCYAVRK